jgi:pantoate--beta-alanine ligase
MDIIKNPSEMQAAALKALQSGKKTALVPTMGFFHEGHLSLIRWARDNADKVVVSLFVNPAQFGPGEDLERYPRDMDRDVRMAESSGVDCLFAPRPGELYPPGFDTWVESPGLSQKLCGESRPGHFRGVATIVCKLFNLTLPGLAVFGLKDRQQLMIISKMVRELDLPVDIVARPTHRESDGLAMSSRNAYLSPEQRKSAPHIYKGLLMIRDHVRSGKTDCQELEKLLAGYYLKNIPGAIIDYLRVVDSSTLKRPSMAGEGTFLAAAVKLGRARLIDNIDLGRTNGSGEHE